MNGPQHYAEAEQLLKTAHQPGKRGVCTHSEAIAQAQVHATLALAAATAAPTLGQLGVPSSEWQEALQ